MVCTGFVADVQRKSNPGVDARGGKRVGAGRPEPPQRRLLPTLGRVGLPLGFLFGRGDERGARVPPACTKVVTPLRDFLLARVKGT